MVQLDTRLPMAIQQPNVLAALDAGTRTAGNQAALMRQAEGQNLFREYGAGAMQGNQNALAAIAGYDPTMAQGMQANNLRMELTRGQIASARQQAAEAARAQKDAAAAAQELAQARNGMRMAGQAFLSGDQRAWGMVTQEFGVPGIPMNEQGLAFLDAIVTGFDEGLAGIVPEQQAPLSPAGKLAADLQAGRITPEQYEAANTRDPLVEVQTGNTAPQVGTIPQGYQLMQGADGAWQMAPIPGGPADTTETDARRAGSRETEGSIVTTAAARAREAARTRAVGGLVGRGAALNPSSQNAELYRQVDVLRAQAQLGNLTAMREASPTGGALGSVTEGELKILADKSGALDPASPTFLRDLDDYELTLLQTIHGPEAGRRIFQETRDVRSVPGRGSVPIDPPAAAISLLRKDPSQDARREFDEAFGEGAAARALGQ